MGRPSKKSIQETVKDNDKKPVSKKSVKKTETSEIKEAKKVTKNTVIEDEEKEKKEKETAKPTKSVKSVKSVKPSKKSVKTVSKKSVKSVTKSKAKKTKDIESNDELENNSSHDSSNNNDSSNNSDNDNNSNYSNENTYNSNNYDDPDMDAYRNPALIESLCCHHNCKALHKFLGDFLVSTYKKTDPHQQSLWCSDVDRATYIIREKEESGNKWNIDNKGEKLKKIIIDPLFKYLQDEMQKYLTNRLSKGGVSSERLKEIDEIKTVIENNVLATNVIRYMAPFFTIIMDDDDENNY